MSAVLPTRTPMMLRSTEALAALVRGSRLMTRLLGVTLGPHGSTVIAPPPSGQGCPQVLSRAGTVARRVIEVPDPFENMGAMLVRHAACRVDAEVGDGVATTAVVLGSLLAGGSRLVRAGYSPQRLATEIEAAAGHLLADLAGARLDLEGAAAVGSVVAQEVPEPEVAEAVRAAAEAVGNTGCVEVRDALGARTSVEFVEGLRCRGELLSAPPTDLMVAVRELGVATVAVSADPVADGERLLGLLDRLAHRGTGCLLLVAPRLEAGARAALDAAHATAELPRVLAVTPRAEGMLEDTLFDLAAYCGTRVLGADSGDRLDLLDPAQLGSVRRAWVGTDEFGVVGTGGQAGARDRARHLRALADTCRDPEVARALRRRVAGLTGQVALLVVGGRTDVERAERRARVEAVLRSAQLAASTGVVAGGGSALATADVGPATVGALALRSAAAEPLRRIAARAGLEPGALLERTRQVPAGHRYDVVGRRWLAGQEPGVVDPLAVVECAVRTAVSTVTTVLGSAVVLRCVRPERTVDP